MMSKETWDKQPNETSQSYEGFCIYRDLGAGRSLVNAETAYREKHKKSTRKVQENNASATFNRWSAKHNWTTRATDYDTYIEAQVRKKTEAKRIAQAVRAKDLLTEASINILENNVIASAIANSQLDALAKAIDDKSKKKTVELKDVIALQRAAGDSGDKALKALEVIFGEEFATKKQIELAWKKDLEELLPPGTDIDEFIEGI